MGWADILAGLGAGLETTGQQLVATQAAKKAEAERQAARAAEIAERQADRAARIAEQAREQEFRDAQAAASGIVRGQAPAAPRISETAPMVTQSMTTGLPTGMPDFRDATRYQQVGGYYVDRNQSPQFQRRQERQELTATQAVQRATEHSERVTEREAQQRFQQQMQDRLFAQQRALEAQRQAGDRAAQQAKAGTAATKPPTEQQQRFGIIAPQLQAADSTIAALENQAPSLYEQTVGKIPLVGNLFKPERRQQIDQAADLFAQHYLYGLSGASSPDPEVERVSNSVRSRPGDADATRKQKEATRRLMVQGAQRIAAPAAGAARPVTPAPRPGEPAGDAGAGQTVPASLQARARALAAEGKPPAEIVRIMRAEGYNVAP